MKTMLVLKMIMKGYLMIKLTKQEFRQKVLPNGAISAEWDLLPNNVVKINDEIYLITTLDLENMVILEKVEND